MRNKINELLTEIQNKDLIIEEQNKEIGIKKTLKQDKKAERNKRYYFKHKTNNINKEKQTTSNNIKQIKQNNSKPKQDQYNYGLEMLRELRI